MRPSSAFRSAFYSLSLSLAPILSLTLFILARVLTAAKVAKKEEKLNAQRAKQAAALRERQAKLIAEQMEARKQRLREKNSAAAAKEKEEKPSSRSKKSARGGGGGGGEGASSSGDRGEKGASAGARALELVDALTARGVSKGQAISAARANPGKSADEVVE